MLTSEAGFEKLAEIPLFFLSTKTNTARAAEQGIHQKGASSGHRCSREVLVLYTGDGHCAVYWSVSMLHEIGDPQAL